MQGHADADPDLVIELFVWDMIEHLRELFLGHINRCAVDLRAVAIWLGETEQDVLRHFIDVRRRPINGLIEVSADMLGIRPDHKAGRFEIDALIVWVMLNESLSFIALEIEMARPATGTCGYNEACTRDFGNILGELCK